MYRIVDLLDDQIEDRAGEGIPAIPADGFAVGLHICLPYVILLNAIARLFLLHQKCSVGAGPEMDGDAQRNRQEKQNAPVAGAFCCNCTGLY